MNEEMTRGGYDAGYDIEGRGGYDGGLSIDISGTWDKRKWGGLRERLFEIRSGYKLMDYPEQHLELIEFGGRSWEVQYSGGNRKISQYTLRGGGIRLFIDSKPHYLNESSSGRNYYDVHAKFEFEALCGKNLYDQHANLISCLEMGGFKIRRDSDGDYCERLTRVDLQLIVFHSVSEFVQAFNEDRVVTLNRDEVLYKRLGQKEHGILLKGPTQLCIYDKRIELKRQERSPSGSEKIRRTVESYIGVAWNNTTVPITRVEFRLMTADSLRENGIITLKDLLHKENELVDKLTSKWFRILDRPKVNGHYNKPISPLWQEVREGFMRNFPGTKEAHLQKIEKVKILTPNTNIAQAMGCLYAEACRSLGVVNDVKEYNEYVRNIVEMNLICNDSPKFKQLLRKAKAQEVLYGDVGFSR